jgi:hypothetical protein
MNRAMKFSSAAMGMAFLAGLAYYQGGADPTLGEEDALIGTALVEPTDIDVTKELAVDVMNDGDCESTAGLDDPTADECTEKERSSGTE